MELYFMAQQLKPSFRGAELHEMPAIALLGQWTVWVFPWAETNTVLLAEFVYVDIYCMLKQHKSPISLAAFLRQFKVFGMKFGFPDD